MTEAALFELLSLEYRVYSSGAVTYLNRNGHVHREYGPAIEYANGGREWYHNGRLHRLDGPAIEYSDGFRAWYQNGQQHRLDGPAIEYCDGSYGWYINGNPLSEAEWLQAVASMEDV